MTVLGHERAAVGQEREVPAGTAGTPRRWEVARCAALGLGAGVAWGALARAWMAFLVDVPAFTWGGTLVILALSGGAGLALGVLEGLRRRGARLWRLLVAVPSLLLFVGQGIPFLPGAVLGGLALSGRGPVGLRVAAAVVGAVPGALFWVPAFAFDGGGPRWVAALWFELLAAALAVGWTAVWRRRRPGVGVSGAAGAARAATAA